MTHVQVWVDGVDVTCRALGELSISGGRRDKLSRADAANAALRIEWPDTERLPHYGSRLDIAGWPTETVTTPVRALFTGRITDLAYQDGWLSILAVDPMADLVGLPVGDTPWPVQNIAVRLAAVWDAARAAAGYPAWMGDGTDLVNDAYIGSPTADMRVAARDVDRQPALDLVGHYLDWLQGVVYYDPDTPQESPGHPSAWLPKARMRSGLKPFIPPVTLPRVPCTMIVSDPPQRRWQSVASIVNDWTVEALNLFSLDEQGNPTPINATATDPQSIRSYGPRASRYRTELLWEDIPGTNPGINGPHHLAGLLLDRTADPAWNLDLCTVLVDDQVPAADIRSAWYLTLWGPGAAGTYVELEKVAGSDRLPDGYYGWVVESQEWRWTLDGWELDLNLSALGLYTGSKPPVDWRNNYAELAAAHLTYAALLAAHSTYADALTTSHPHPAGV